MIVLGVKMRLTQFKWGLGMHFLCRENHRVQNLSTVPSYTIALLIPPILSQLKMGMTVIDVQS